MDRLLSISGGQPLRTNDWEFIQNVTEVILKAILNGLLPDETSFIVSGMAVTESGDISVAEGYFFDGTEICYVPAAGPFAEHDGYKLYMTPDITTTENRTFKDTTTHDVHQLRRYTCNWGATVPEGSIELNSLPMITKLASLINGMLSLNAVFVYAASLRYSTGFANATTYEYVYIQKNDINQRMILAAFNANVTQGLLTTLPAGHRPTGDVVGFFFNGTVAPGVLKIKKNDEIWISGASTTATNYITFQFSIGFLDPVLWGLPTTGGGPSPDGDISL